MSFDVNDESFCEIILPPNHLDGVPVNFDQLAVFKVSLAAFVFVHGHRGIFCHIWRSMVWPNLGQEIYGTNDLGLGRLFSLAALITVNF